MSLLWEPNPTAADNVHLVLGDGMHLVESGPTALRRLASDLTQTLLVVGADVDLNAALDVSEQLRLERPEVGVILLRRRVDVTVLGQALRAGVREVVGAEDLNGLTQACRRSEQLSERLAALNGAPSTKDGRIVTVFSAKGGVGKTTVSTNLAAELSSDGRTRVLLVDLDLAFGDVAISLGLMPENTMVDIVAMAGNLDAQGLASVVTHHESGLDALCAPAQPGDAERIPGSTVTELLRVARHCYDFVILDTPPAFTEHVLSAFDASDLSILLGTLDIPAIKNLRLTLDTLDLLGHPRDAWVVVLNRSDAKVGLSAADVTAALGRTIAVQIPNSLSVPAATNRGVPIVLGEPRHAVSQALKTLVREYIRADDAAAGGGKAHQGSGREVGAGSAAGAPASAVKTPTRRLFRRSAV